MSYSSSDVDLVIPADDDGQRTKIERERTPVPTTQEGPRTNPNKCICHISLNDFKLHRNGIAVAKTVSFIYIVGFLLGLILQCQRRFCFARCHRSISQKTNNKNIHHHIGTQKGGARRKIRQYDNRHQRYVFMFWCVY